MPTMYEIYEKHAGQYDEMVETEDYKGNLRLFLLEKIDWSNVNVLEAGVGTGRVTNIFVDQIASATCCDRSAHMIAFAEQKLADYKHKLNFVLANNLNLPDFGHQFDLFIQGWSFGHQIMDCSSLTEIKTTIGRLVENSLKNIRPGGKIIYIETLGTNSTVPNPPHEKLSAFYEIIEQKYQFERHEIQTDYRYKSVDEAIAKLGFFFGDEMQQQLREQNETLVPEWTGIWTKQI
ncbi:MAG: class I SAM-dependent methyltransferase [Anaerolineae bacterium]